MSQWKGKVTEELKELYIKYAELFDGMSPGGYAELDGCYDNISYEEFVGYIKECIKQKEEMPDVMFSLEEVEEKEKEALNLLNELYLRYVSVFGELPKNYKEIEGYQNLSDEKKKEIESTSLEEIKQYIERAIKRKEKDTISDCIVFVFRKLILEAELDDD